MADELQKHLDKGMYGTPLVKPDEQRQYMGTFRERCYLSMTIAEMRKAENKTHLVQELKQHDHATILLNGAMPESLQAEYIQLATKNQAQFTVVNDFVKSDPDSFGLLLTAKEAVDVPEIDIEKKYPPNEAPKTEESTKKPGFFGKLFGG